MKEKWEALRKKYWPPGKDQFLIMALCGLLRNAGEQWAGNRAPAGDR